MTDSSRLPAAALAATALLFCACTGLRRVPFVNGSPDFNGGAPHEADFPGTEPTTLAERLAALAGARGLSVSEKNCEAGQCFLVLDAPVNEIAKDFQFSSPPKPTSRPPAKTRPSRAGQELDFAMAGLELLSVLGEDGREQTKTTTLRAKFSSRYFARITPSETGARLELAGAPVRNNDMSCPPAVAARLRPCKPPPFAVLGEDTPPESMRRHWGVDISGRAEAAAIEELLKGLKNAGPVESAEQ